MPRLFSKSKNEWVFPQNNPFAGFPLYFYAVVARVLRRKKEGYDSVEEFRSVWIKIDGKGS